MKRVRQLLIHTMLVLSLAFGLTPSIAAVPDLAAAVTVQAATYSKSTVKAVQNKLNKLGYNCGTADGVAGSKTKTAIKQYQKAKGLTVTGVVDKALLKSLGITGTTVSNSKSTTGSSDKKTTTVYITDTGSKYHRSGCRYLRKSQISISLDEAKKSYDPCSVCKP